MMRCYYLDAIIDEIETGKPNHLLYVKDDT